MFWMVSLVGCPLSSCILSPYASAVGKTYSMLFHRLMTLGQIFPGVSFPPWQFSFPWFEISATSSSWSLCACVNCALIHVSIWIKLLSFRDGWTLKTSWALWLASQRHSGCAVLTVEYAVRLIRAPASIVIYQYNSSIITWYWDELALGSLHRDSFQGLPIIKVEKRIVFIRKASTHSIGVKAVRFIKLNMLLSASAITLSVAYNSSWWFTIWLYLRIKLALLIIFWWFRIQGQCCYKFAHFQP